MGEWGSEMEKGRKGMKGTLSGFNTIDTRGTLRCGMCVFKLFTKGEKELRFSPPTLHLSLLDGCFLGH